MVHDRQDRTHAKDRGHGEFHSLVAEDSINPFNMWGQADPVFQWAGWLYAVDADSGQWRWRARTNYPVQSGVAPTAGGVVFFGDMGGNLYALDADTGRNSGARRSAARLAAGHYLHHAPGSTCRRRDRSHGSPLADRDNDSQGFDPGPRQQLSGLLVAPLLLTHHGTGEGEQFILHAPHSPRAAQN